MSKKNNRGKDKRYNAFLIQLEKNNEKRKQELKARKENSRIKKMEAERTEQRKLMSRKPKVPPVVGSKVKLDKMLKK